MIGLLRRRRIDWNEDCGQVGGIEVLPFGLLVFIVGTLLVANAWAVVDAKLAVTSAAREAVRSYVEADDGAVFPAALGWHPWFTKPDRLVVHPLAMFEQDDVGLPTGRLVTPTDPPWDDCFVLHEPVELHYDRRLAPVVTVASPDCEYWVVFDKPAHATCVEPQSGPPDALTLRPELPTSARPLRRTMTIDW